MRNNGDVCIRIQRIKHHHLYHEILTSIGIGRRNVLVGIRHQRGIEGLLNAAVKQQGGHPKPEHGITAIQLLHDGDHHLIVCLLGQLVEKRIDRIVVCVVLLADLSVNCKQCELSPIGGLFCWGPANNLAPKGRLEGNLEGGDDRANGIAECRAGVGAKRIESRNIHSPLLFCLDNRIRFLPMGNCFGVDQPMMTIGIKTIRASKFKEIKTYKDALRMAGHIVPDDESLTIFRNESIAFAPAYTKFQFADAIRYKKTTLPMKKLYGK